MNDSSLIQLKPTKTAATAEPNADSLHAAILRTIRYADIFEHALSPAEIHLFLDSFKAPLEEVQSGAIELILSGELIENKATGWVALPDRSHLFLKRLERNHRARPMWRQATAFGKFIGRLPFVRMVAVTGSLAVDNPAKQADIDYFIVTEPKRLWLTRLLIVSIVKAAEPFGITLCPNYFVSTNNLAIKAQNLYTAREICQHSWVRPCARLRRCSAHRSGDRRRAVRAGDLAPGRRTSCRCSHPFLCRYGA